MLADASSKSSFEGGVGTTHGSDERNPTGAAATGRYVTTLDQAEHTNWLFPQYGLDVRVGACVPCHKPCRAHYNGVNDNYYEVQGCGFDYT